MKATLTIVTGDLPERTGYPDRMFVQTGEVRIEAEDAASHQFLLYGLRLSERLLALLNSERMFVTGATATVHFSMPDEKDALEAAVQAAAEVSEVPA